MEGSNRRAGRDEAGRERTDSLRPQLAPLAASLSLSLGSGFLPSSQELVQKGLDRLTSMLDCLPIGHSPFLTSSFNSSLP